MAERKVAIVGAALSDIARVDDKTAYELHIQATKRAPDAGLTKDDIGGLMSCGAGTFVPVDVAGHLGITRQLDWVDSTQVGGASWELYVEHAIAAIRAGLTDVVVLAYGSTARADLNRKYRRAKRECGARQVGGAEVACVNGTGGWFSSASTILLGKDR